MNEDKRTVERLVKLADETLSTKEKEIRKEEEEKGRRHISYNSCTECDLEFFDERNIKKYWIILVDILGFSDLVIKGRLEFIYEMLSFLSNYHSEKHSHFFVKSTITCSDTCINLYEGIPLQKLIVSSEW